MRDHLALMVSVGANYVRNTMGARDEGRPEAATLQAFGQPNGNLFDLNTWNDAYWDRFETFLGLTREYGIFVQIELWDPFDFVKQWWEISAWNPRSNINYTYEETILQPNAEGPTKEAQPFFLSVPALKNDTVLLPSHSNIFPLLEGQRSRPDGRTTQ